MDSLLGSYVSVTKSPNHRLLESEFSFYRGTIRKLVQQKTFRVTYGTCLLACVHTYPSIIRRSVERQASKKEPHRCCIGIPRTSETWDHFLGLYDVNVVDLFLRWDVSDHRK